MYAQLVALQREKGRVARCACVNMLRAELWPFADRLPSPCFDKSVAGYVTDPLKVRYQEHARFGCKDSAHEADRSQQSSPSARLSNIGATDDRIADIREGHMSRNDSQRRVTLEGSIVTPLSLIVKRIC